MTLAFDNVTYTYPGTRTGVFDLAFRIAPGELVALVGAQHQLGRLALTEDGLRRRELLVARLAIERGVPLASTVGGGYGPDKPALAKRHVDAILTLGAAFAR